MSVRSPTVRGARTEDLQAELNRKRAGKDARISVERARERHLNIEGRNLNADLDVAAPKPPASWGGLRCAGGSPPRGGMAVQVPPPPAGDVRRYH